MEIRYDTDLPAFIRQARTDLGLSQSQCAQRSGVDPAAWSRAERGGYRRMTWEMGIRMLYGLGVVMNVNHIPVLEELPLFREAAPGDNEQS